MHERVWVRSGIVEELTRPQVALLENVMEKIRYYYRELHRTPGHPHPLSLKSLMKLTNRSGASVLAAIRLLANTVPIGANSEPPIYYDRVRTKIGTHRPYRIFLRRRVID